MLTGLNAGHISYPFVEFTNVPLTPPSLHISGSQHPLPLWPITNQPTPHQLKTKLCPPQLTRRPSGPDLATGAQSPSPAQTRLKLLSPASITRPSLGPLPEPRRPLHLHKAARQARF